MPAGLSSVVVRVQPAGWLQTDGFAVGGGLPGFDVDGGVAFGGHVFGFDAVGVVADAALLVGDAGFFLEPVGDGVAPDDGVAGLVGEEFQGLVVALVVDEAVEGLPAWGVGLRGGCAFVVGVVDVLDYGFAVVQDVRVGDVVHEEEEIVGAGVDVLVDLGELGWILADVAGAGGYGAVHADACARRRGTTGPSRCARRTRCRGRSGSRGCW